MTTRSGRRGLGRSPRRAPPRAGARASGRRAARRSRRSRRRARRAASSPVTSRWRSWVTTSSSPLAYWARSTFLSNLPTEVFGTASMNAHWSGSHHLATRGSRNATSSAGVGGSARRVATTQTSGRSAQRSSGIATTAASKTAGVRHHLVLELDRADPLAAGLDHVLGPVRDREEPERVERARRRRCAASRRGTSRGRPTA